MTSASAKPEAVRGAIDAIPAQRVQFPHSLAVRTGNDSGRGLLQKNPLKALQHDDLLRRCERFVARFYRILRNAVVDHDRAKTSARRRAGRLWSEMWVARPSISTTGWQGDHTLVASHSFTRGYRLRFLQAL